MEVGTDEPGAPAAGGMETAHPEAPRGHVSAALAPWASGSCGRWARSSSLRLCLRGSSLSPAESCAHATPRRISEGSRAGDGAGGLWPGGAPWARDQLASPAPWLTAAPLCPHRGRRWTAAASCAAASRARWPCCGTRAGTASATCGAWRSCSASWARTRATRAKVSLSHTEQALPGLRAAALLQGPAGSGVRPMASLCRLAASFARAAQVRLHDLLWRQEESCVFGRKDWVVQEASNPDALQEAGTFRY